MKILSIILLLTSIVFCAVYDVGIGHTYSAVGDVPWESLSAGDIASGIYLVKFNFDDITCSKVIYYMR